MQWQVSPQYSSVSVVPRDDPGGAFVWMALSPGLGPIPSSVVNPSEQFTGVKVVVYLLDGRDGGGRHRGGIILSMVGSCGRMPYDGSPAIHLHLYHWQCTKCWSLLSWSSNYLKWQTCHRKICYLSQFGRGLFYTYLGTSSRLRLHQFRREQYFYLHRN